MNLLKKLPIEVPDIKNYVVDQNQISMAPPEIMQIPFIKSPQINQSNENNNKNLTVNNRCNH